MKNYCFLHISIFFALLVQSKFDSCVLYNPFSWNPFKDQDKFCLLSKENLKPKYIELSKFPKIHLYKSCISEKQRKELLSLAAQRLSSETDSGFSSSLYLRDTGDAELPILKEIAKLAGNLSGLPWNNAEPISLTKYTLKQNYGLHYDSGFLMNGKRTNRKATVLLYLNNVKKGGETVFPFATNQTDSIEHNQVERKPIQEVCASERGVKIPPVLGSCVVFYSHLDEASQVDPLSLHGSCPVLSGEKWIAQMWVRGKIENEKDTFWKD
ncbi:prolyl 4-hydroxylase 2-like [Actinia tenebrosa]|uniref:Prolyl 4-hydroxylase 2-like n=1 Tax=Actinia tenebrosa TaxID=6105 RepID=A0A6P8IJ65_ACTTE|nr:prolyl 4-hydroxylase 2-like [Actinia tenebrosa]